MNLHCEVCGSFIMKVGYSENILHHGICDACRKSLDPRTLKKALERSDPHLYTKFASKDRVKAKRRRERNTDKGPG